MSDPGRTADFRGLRVLSLESRKAGLMEQAIRHYGGEPFVAPSVKEIPFEQHDAVYAWAERLFDNEFNLLVLMTGTGLVFLRDILAERYPHERFAAALRKTTIVSRGPKPVAILRDSGGGVARHHRCRSPIRGGRSWGRSPLDPKRRITIQEYGRANPDLVRPSKNWERT